MIYTEDTYHLLSRPNERGYLPRQTVCGSAEAEAMGLVSVLNYPDKLVDPKDYAEVIAKCHEFEIFPIYHRKATDIRKRPWNQNGLNFCWAYGLSMAVMTRDAQEGKPYVALAPESLGWLVNWRNAGYYCDRAIAGAAERGIASREYVPEHSLTPSKFKAGWEQDALLHRPARWFDTTRKDGAAKMAQQCISILAAGVPLYVAYDWWGHALECQAVQIDARGNLSWWLDNSHGEQDYIVLTGERGIPDEAYGLSATAGLTHGRTSCD